MPLSKMLQEYRQGLRGLPTYDELVAIASSAPMTQERFNEKMDALDKVNPEPLARLMAATDQCADPIVERNVSLLRQRSTVGVQKYGTTLADNKLPLRAWLNHALEEALDQANYLQAAMAEIDAAEQKVAADERQSFESWITAAFDECGEDEPNLTLDENGRYTNDMRVLTSWQVWKARAALPVAPVQAQEPESFEQVRFRFFKGLNTEERKKVFKAFGVWPGDSEGKNIPHAWETLLLRSIFAIAAPVAQADSKELTDSQISEAVRSVGVDTHPSKFGFADEQIEGMSVAVLRQVIEAIAAKATPAPQ